MEQKDADVSESVQADQLIWEGGPHLLAIPKWHAYMLVAGIVGFTGVVGAIMSIWRGVDPTLFAMCSLALWVEPVWLWKCLEVKNQRFEITSANLSEHFGVLNKGTDVMPLFKIDDFHAERPWYLRPFRLMNLVLHTWDKSNPVLHIRAIKRDDDLFTLLTQVAEDNKRKSNLRRYYSA